MAFLTKYAISQQLLTKPSKRRSGLALAPGVRFLVAHDTGNPSSTAAQNVRYYERSRDECSASAHLFVDDREIIECIPALARPEKAWHVRYDVPTDDQLFGHDANDAAIGVEYCYGGQIDADEAYRKYVWLLAYLCDLHALDPRSAIVGHFFLDPKRKTDPVAGLAHSRRSYEQLLRDVPSELVACGGVLPAGASNLPAPPAPAAVALARSMRARARLNLRANEPTTRAPIARVVQLGTLLDAVAATDRGEPVNGNPRWFQTAANEWFWSGAVE